MLIDDARRLVREMVATGRMTEQEAEQAITLDGGDPGPSESDYNDPRSNL